LNDFNEALTIVRFDIGRNTFIFALAGHETSAHTLAFTFGYLATNPKVQEWLFKELDQVMPDGHLPVGLR